MIDLHCHLLPNIDDGPSSLDEALRMARMAVENGVTKVVLTPHIHPGRYDNNIDSITAAFEEFKNVLKQAHIPLALNMAAEVRIGPEVIPLIEKHQIPWLGNLNGYQLLLLEFPHSHIPVGSENFVKWCLARKIRPVIPHPERNKDVIRDLHKIKPFVEMGCLLQITAGALTGVFGYYAKRRARQLLKKGWVSFLGSDAHNTLRRIPNLEPGRKVAQAIIGEEASWKLVRDNPESILTGAINVPNRPRCIHSY